MPMSLLTSAAAASLAFVGACAIATPVCSITTTDSCNVLPCNPGLGDTTCVSGSCMCASGNCLQAHVCECSRSTPGTCLIFGCDSMRGPTVCEDGMCKCQHGLCGQNGHCFTPPGATNLAAGNTTVSFAAELASAAPAPPDRRPALAGAACLSASALLVAVAVRSSRTGMPAAGAEPLLCADQQAVEA